MNNNKIFELAKKHGIEQLQIDSLINKSTIIKTVGNKIEKVQNNENEGMIISGIINGNKNSSYFVDLTDEGVERNISKLRKFIDLKTKDGESEFIDGKGLVYLENKSISYPELTGQERIEILDNVYNAVVDCDHRIIKDIVEVYLGYELNESSKTNSLGLNLSKKVGGEFSIYVVVSAKEGEENVQSVFHKEYFTKDEIDYDYIRSTLSTRLKLRFGAKKIESKKYDVVFDNGIFYSLLQTILSNFNAKNVIDKLSLFEDKIGQRIASDKITINDYAVIPENNYFKTYDEDGMPTQNITLVDKGILKTFIHNLETAKAMNTKSTGHGAGRKPGHNMLFVENGFMSQEEILEKVNNGIYIDDLSGLHSGVNAKSGDFSVEMSGNLILNGKLDHPISSAVISGNIFEMLKNVDMLGNDNNFSEGIFCPTISFKDVSIAG